MRSRAIFGVMALAFAAGCGGAAGGETVSGMWDGRQTARLDVVSGSDTVFVAAADLGTELFRASVPVGSRVVPQAQVTDSAVRVSLSDGPGSGPADLVVELNSGVDWEIRLDGGSKQASVAMERGKLSALDFGAGSSRIEARLPAPSGTVPVRMAGGASVFDVKVPHEVATQVRVAGGAGSATIDGTVHNGISGGTVYTPDGWDAANDRYLIDNIAGLSAFTLTRP